MFKKSRTIIIPDDNEDEEDDNGGGGFPIDMNCNQIFDSENFPNEDLNHVEKVFCPKMCFSLVADINVELIGSKEYHWTSSICKAAR